MERWTIVIAILALSLTQVPGENVEVDFVENVIQNTKSGRIVSGWEAYPGQHPWQVSIRMVSGDGGVSSCGGSVVHSDWVITAAHCTATRVTIVVRGGLVNLTTPMYISETTIWFNYPTFNDNTPFVVQPDDISIMKMMVSFTFNHLLQPIRVQPLIDAHRNYDTERMMASGYGRTWTGGSLPEVLHWVYLLGVSNQACGSVFGTIITDTTICARYYNVTSQSTCQGDSGGPLVHLSSEGVPTLVGIASFVAGGDFGCHSGFPAGFCRVGPFLPWLKAVTGIDFDSEDGSNESSGDGSGESNGSGSGESNGSGSGESNSSGSGESNSSGSGESNSSGSGEGKGSGSGESNSSGSSESKGSGEGNGSSDDSDDCDDKKVTCKDKECSELLRKLDVRVKVHVRMRN